MTGFAKTGLPQTSNLLTSTIHKLRRVKAMNFKFVKHSSVLYHTEAPSYGFSNSYTVECQLSEHLIIRINAKLAAQSILSTNVCFIRVVEQSSVCKCMDA